MTPDEIELSRRFMTLNRVQDFSFCQMYDPITGQYIRILSPTHLIEPEFIPDLNDEMTGARLLFCLREAPETYWHKTDSEVVVTLNNVKKHESEYRVVLSIKRPYPTHPTHPRQVFFHGRTLAHVCAQAFVSFTEGL